MLREMRANVIPTATATASAASADFGRLSDSACDGRWPGMRYLPGGRFRMGSNDHYPEEAPVRTVRDDPFGSTRRR